MDCEITFWIYKLDKNDVIYTQFHNRFLTMAQGNLVPPRLEDWDIETVNLIVTLNDIEGDEFDFKGPEFSELYQDICAMANTSGGYIVLGIDEIKNKETGHFIKFEKKGFGFGERHRVEIGINNARINIEPDPTMNYRNIEEEDKKTFYPVIKVENIHDKKPFFVKGSGRCFIRAGKSSPPASRSTVINLFSNYIQRKNSILKLRVACRDLIEQIRYTSEDIESANPGEASNVIKPVNLFFLQNSVLDAEWFFLKNDLYGGHIDENSNIEVKLTLCYAA